MKTGVGSVVKTPVISVDTFGTVCCNNGTLSYQSSVSSYIRLNPELGLTTQIIGNPGTSLLTRAK